MPTLNDDVYVGLKKYEAGTDANDIPAGDLRRLTNPDIWSGGLPTFPSELTEIVIAGPAPNDGDTLVWSDADEAWTAVPPNASSGSAGVVDGMYATQQVVSTTDETTVATLVLPAGSVAQNTRLRICALGRLLTNDGATRVHTYRLKANGVTLLTLAKSQTASGNKVSWWLQYDIDSASATEHNVGLRGGFAGGGGIGDAVDGTAMASANGVSGWAESTEDFSGEVTFTLTIQEATAAAANYDEVFSVTLEKSPPLG